MVIDSGGGVISFDGGYPECIGRHWKYCGFMGEGKIYSYDGIYWYAFGRDEMVSVVNDAIDAFPCSVWEMLHLKRIMNDVEFVSFNHYWIGIDQLLGAGISVDNILEGLLV